MRGVFLAYYMSHSIMVDPSETETPRHAGMIMLSWAARSRHLYCCRLTGWCVCQRDGRLLKPKRKSTVSKASTLTPKGLMAIPTFLCAYLILTCNSESNPRVSVSGTLLLAVLILSLNLQDWFLGV